MDRKLFWILTAGAVFCHAIASAITWHFLENGVGRECNPNMAFAFQEFGHGPVLAFTTITIILLFFAINQSEKYGMITEPFEISALTIFTSLMALDAAHDIFAITDNPVVNFSMVFFRLIYGC